MFSQGGRCGTRFCSDRVHVDLTSFHTVRDHELVSAAIGPRDIESVVESQGQCRSSEALIGQLRHRSTHLTRRRERSATIPVRRLGSKSTSGSVRLSSAAPVAPSGSHSLALVGQIILHHLAIVNGDRLSQHSRADHEEWRFRYRRGYRRCRGPRRIRPQVVR